MITILEVPLNSSFLVNDVNVEIININGRQIGLGIKAPADVRVDRLEIYEKVKWE